MATIGEEENVLPSSAVEVEECLSPSPLTVVNVPVATPVETPEVEELTTTEAVPGKARASMTKKNINIMVWKSNSCLCSYGNFLYSFLFGNFSDFSK